MQLGLGVVSMLLRRIALLRDRAYTLPGEEVAFRPPLKCWLRWCSPGPGPDSPEVRVRTPPGSMQRHLRRPPAVSRGQVGAGLVPARIGGRYSSVNYNPS